MNKQEVNEKIKELINLPIIKNNQKLSKELLNLQRTIDNDVYCVVVMGEFKRGKSTFVNSLLGDKLLPMAVLPETATVNFIMYSEKPYLQVIYKNGVIENGEVNETFLKQFSARVEGSKATDVNYIRIGYPVEMLKNHIVFIDTPGVSDLDETRCDVTYGIIPIANAIIFLMDANTPFTKSERDFIVERLIPQGVDDILFILNKYDCVDEEEEDDLLDDLNIRLRKAFAMDTDNPKLKKITLLTLSASMALEGITENNELYINESGINNVKDTLLEMLDSSKIEINKNKYYVTKLNNIIGTIIRGIDTKIAMHNADIESMNKIAESLRDMINKKSSNGEKIEEYAKQFENNILLIVDKSISFFNQKLKEDVISEIKDYPGSNFKDFIEIHIAKKIQKNIEMWVGTYSKNINFLIKKMEQELSFGLSKNFNSKINLNTKINREFKTQKYLFAVEATDLSSDNKIMNYLTAGIGVAIMATIGSLLAPLVGTFSSSVKEGFFKRNLDNAKTEIIPEIESHIASVMLKLQQEIHMHISNQCKSVRLNTEYAFNAILEIYTEEVNKQINAKISKNEDTEKIIEQLILARKELISLCSNVK